MMGRSPEPGGLRVLENDEACAAVILTVLRVVAAGRSRGPVRFVIAPWWVGPRVPPPVTDRKRGMRPVPVRGRTARRRRLPRSPQTNTASRQSSWPNTSRTAGVAPICARTASQSPRQPAMVGSVVRRFAGGEP